MLAPSHTQGVVNALTRITREEGMKGLFAGNTPVVIRAMALNMGMLSTHDQGTIKLPIRGSCLLRSCFESVIHMLLESPAYFRAAL